MRSDISRFRGVTQVGDALVGRHVAYRWRASKAGGAAPAFRAGEVLEGRSDPADDVRHQCVEAE
jgi:hypothetical protein